MCVCVRVCVCDSRATTFTFTFGKTYRLDVVLLHSIKIAMDLLSALPPLVAVVFLLVLLQIYMVRYRSSARITSPRMYLILIHFLAVIHLWLTDFVLAPVKCLSNCWIRLFNVSLVYHIPRLRLASGGGSGGGDGVSLSIFCWFVHKHIYIAYGIECVLSSHVTQWM